ncbi:hypothetical protein N9M38_03070, partial [Planktomarina temperata]|nr:hypothetical protein [Planktomarina temperata]
RLRDHPARLKLVLSDSAERSISTVVCYMHHARTSRYDAVDKVFTYRSSYFHFNHLRRSLTVIIKSENRHAACP